MARCILAHYRTIGALVALLALDGVLPAFAAKPISMTITQTGNAFTIYPGIAVTAHQIASINIASVDPYSVSLTDNKNGKLVNGSNVLPYEVEFSGAGKKNLSTGTPKVIKKNGQGNNNDEDLPLTIFVLAGKSIGIPAGDYTVTIYIELAAQ